MNITTYTGLPSSPPSFEGEVMETAGVEQGSRDLVHISPPSFEGEVLETCKGTSRW